MVTTQPLDSTQLLASAHRVADAAIPLGSVKRLATGTGIALTGRFLGRGLRLLVDIALARVLGPH